MNQKFKYHLLDVENYKFLNYKFINCRDIDDSKEFNILLNAFKVMGLQIVKLMIYLK